jgi:primosomal protein N' (replication factor Y)
MHEQAGSYKLEDGIRFNVRDCAIMRGFLERTPVLMTSSAPSMESWANALSGKYRLLDLHSGIKIPKVRTVDMRFAKKVRPYLSSSVIVAAKGALQRNKKVLFLLNRRGHSTMLHCAECGTAERCAECSIPLVLHKDENIMRCHYCGRNVAIPETCNKCKSSRLELLGAGTQKIEEDMREFFGVGTIRLDSDKAARKTAVKDMLARASQDETCILVGTKMLANVLRGAVQLGMAAMLNPDIALNIPDFRAREKAFQELVTVRDLVSLSGELLLQTRLSHEPLFRHIRDNDFEAFAAEELSLRKDLHFPPYSKMMDIVISCDRDLPDKAVRLIALSSKEIEILGPTERKTRKGKIEYSILIRHSERKLLHTAVRSLLKKVGEIPDAEIRVDVDPN